MSLLSLLVASQLAATPITIEEVREASRESLDAVRARLDVQRAVTNTTTSRSVILPQVDLNLGSGMAFIGQTRQFNTVPVLGDNNLPTGDFEQRLTTTKPTEQGRFNFGVSVNQLIYDGGRWWNQLAQSGELEEATRGQLIEQQLSSELEAVRRFFELVKAQLTLKVFVETLERSKQQVDRASALYEAGRSSRAAVYDARTNLANDEINVVRQKQRIAQTRLSMLQWIGRSDADVVAVVPDKLDQPAPAFETLAAVKTARQKRPLFKSLDARIRAGELGVAVSRADYFPRLGVSANYSRNSPELAQFVDPTQQNILSIGANLTWDLFSGFQHVAQEERARIELSDTEAQRRQAIVDLETEIARANQAYATEVEVLAISERNLGVAQEQTRLEEERFSAGAGSTLEVRNAQIKYTQAQLSVLQGRADVATARAALERAVGGTP